MKHRYLDISLTLFDGGGDGGGAAAPAPAAGAPTQGADQKGDSKAVPGSTRRGKSTGEFQKVVFGRQTETGAQGPAEADTRAQPTDEGGEGARTTTTSDTLEAKRKAFQDLVNGEYKDIYTEETQRIINRRFRETQNLEQQVGRNQGVIDLLLQRYHIADGDVGKLTAAIESDDAYWSQAAEEAGMNVEQYRQFQKLQRENAALQQAQRRQQGQQAAQERLETWYKESEQVKTLYPDFDLGREVDNPQFLSLLKSGVPVRHAYEVIHMDDIKAGVAQNTARQTEKQVVDGIRAKGTRPAENGTSAQSAFTVKDDVSKLTKEERAEIARRVARGENISF